MLKENFYSIFPEYFERNSRWSYKMSEVPKLGDADATREEVEAFYEYWYEFKSWRDYHWEDEEDIESAQDRYEKREIEKFNRSARYIFKSPFGLHHPRSAIIGQQVHYCFFEG